MFSIVKNSSFAILLIGAIFKGDVLMVVRVNFHSKGV